MKKRRSRLHGAMLIELLIASFLSLLIGAAILVMVQTTYSARDVVQGESSANAWARHSLDVLCDSLRNAQSVQIQTGPTVNAALQAGSANSITCYTDSVGDTTTYWLDTGVNPPALKKTSGGVTSVLVSGVASLTLTYYTIGQYTGAGNTWSTTASPNNPTSTERPHIGGVGIAATISLNGYTRRISSFVRLRNSPL